MKKYDVIIVGAEPAGFFTAIEMLRSGTKQKILIVEKGIAAKIGIIPIYGSRRVRDVSPNVMGSR